MKYIYMLLGFIFSSFILGCVKPVIDLSVSDVYTNYEIGKTHIASIGDQLLRVNTGKFVVKDMYYAIDSCTIEYRNDYNYLQKKVFAINRDDKYTLVSSTPAYLILRPLSSSKSSFTLSITKEGKILKLYDSWGEVNISTKFNQGIVFQKGEPLKTLIGNIYSYELILTEISNEKIKAVYREYSEDLIRGAFSYSVEFNLIENKIIHFRSTTMKIVNCNNNQVEYIVISD